MRHVYVLQSASHPDEHYVGLTNDIEKRVRAHNSGKVPHTAKHMPWRPVVAIRFEDNQRAIAFERYLKSGSGRAFAKRHFWYAGCQGTHSPAAEESIVR